MAEGKKCVVVYADWMKKFDALEDAEAGKLIKHFFRYINDLNPTAPDRITELLFIDIETTLKRDLVKWEKRAEKSRENGNKGGRPPENKNPEEPTKTQQVILEPIKPDIVTVSGSVSVTDTVTGKEKVIEGIKPTPKTLIERKEDFRISLIAFLPEYSKEMLRSFFDYWSEQNTSGKKMKCEMQKTFEVPLRLRKWKEKDKEFKKVIPAEKPSRISKHIETLKTNEQLILERYANEDNQE